MSLTPHVCMLAAENDRIEGAKVGGIGDVLRDLPPALARAGARVSVIIPAYGALHRLADAHPAGQVHVPFQGTWRVAELYRLDAHGSEGVTQYVVHADGLAPCGPGRVYCDDPPDAPFAADASKYALFCRAALQMIADGLLGEVQVLHCHDWHTGFAPVLRAFDPALRALAGLRCVFSIHNLALQGIRPLGGHESSWHGWFPGVGIDADTVRDPRWPDCINPMAAGIRLSDRVHTVSPTYAGEITRPNDAARGFHGGEGLEQDLQRAAAEGRLIGIINGIEYPEPVPGVVPGNSSDDAPDEKTWTSLLTRIDTALCRQVARRDTLAAVDYLAGRRLDAWRTGGARPAHVLTSVGRLTDQKLAILLAPGSDGVPALDALLQGLGEDGVLILLGSGDAALETRCRAAMGRHANLLFLDLYDASLADALYAAGDLFLMPSSFEPCGISQLLAMRAGQPCLVHAVGGLADTVEDSVTGFHFHGDSVPAQADACVKRLAEALHMREHDPGRYAAIGRDAAARRFEWSHSAHRYLTELYS